MKTKLAAIALLVLLLAGCRQQPGTTNAASMNEAPAANADDSANGVAEARQPADRQLLEEPKGAIDPKSIEAAGQVVQQYGALVEQDRFVEAAGSWGNKDQARAFANDLRSRGLKHLEIGDLGEPEGAAGSIFVTMPVVFYQGAKRSPATMTLRRVNDVDGSTAAQRRWHIERIEWAKN